MPKVNNVPSRRIGQVEKPEVRPSTPQIIDRFKTLMAKSNPSQKRDLIDVINFLVIASRRENVKIETNQSVISWFITPQRDEAKRFVVTETSVFSVLTQIMNGLHDLQNRLTREDARDLINLCAFPNSQPVNADGYNNNAYKLIKHFGCNELPATWESGIRELEWAFSKENFAVFSSYQKELFRIRKATDNTPGRYNINGSLVKEQLKTIKLDISKVKSEKLALLTKSFRREEIDKDAAKKLKDVINFLTVSLRFAYEDSTKGLMAIYKPNFLQKLYTPKRQGTWSAADSYTMYVSEAGVLKALKEIFPNCKPEHAQAIIILCTQRNPKYTRVDSYTKSVEILFNTWGISTDTKDLTKLRYQAFQDKYDEVNRKLKEQFAEGLNKEISGTHSKSNEGTSSNNNVLASGSLTNSNASQIGASFDEMLEQASDFSNSMSSIDLDQPSLLVSSEKVENIDTVIRHTSSPIPESKVESTGDVNITNNYEDFEEIDLNAPSTLSNNQPSQQQKPSLASRIFAKLSNWLFPAVEPEISSKNPWNKVTIKPNNTMGNNLSNNITIKEKITIATHGHNDYIGTTRLELTRRSYASAKAGLTNYAKIKAESSSNSTAAAITSRMEINTSEIKPELIQKKYAVSPEKLNQLKQDIHSFLSQQADMALVIRGLREASWKYGKDEDKDYKSLSESIFKNHISSVSTGLTKEIKDAILECPRELDEHILNKFCLNHNINYKNYMELKDNHFILKQDPYIRFETDGNHALECINFLLEGQERKL